MNNLQAFVSGSFFGGGLLCAAWAAQARLWRRWSGSSSVESWPPGVVFDHKSEQTPGSQLRASVSELAEVVQQHACRLQQSSGDIQLALKTADVKGAGDIVNHVERLLASLDDVTRELCETQTLLQTASQELDWPLYIDPLTRVANRHGLEYELQRRITEWRRQRTSLSLIMVDVDYFKRVNDSFGHQAGDVILRRVAGLLQETVREMDLVARYGGEEFCIILPGLGATQGKEAAERIRVAVEAYGFQVDEHELRMTVSLGLTSIRDGDDAGSLLRRADEALYESKRTGRNRIHYDDGVERSMVSAGATARSNAPTGDAGRSQLQEALADSITGLPNRQYLEEELRRRVAETRRYGTPLTLVTVHLDDMARIRGLGAKTTTMVLRTMAQALASQLRESDLVARYGEDLFVALLIATPLREAMAPARRVRKAIEECPELREACGHVRHTVSVGLAEGTTDDVTESILSRALAAGRCAVKAGGNRLYVHEVEHGACPDSPERDLALAGAGR